MTLISRKRLLMYVSVVIFCLGLMALSSCGGGETVDLEYDLVTNPPTSQHQYPDEDSDVLDEQSVTSVFPSIHITFNAASIHRDNWANTTFTVTGAPDGQNFENITGRIRGRGNSTWRLMGEKRPFRIRFDTAQTMLGSDYVARDWSFIANAMDYSLMRNFAVYSFAASLGNFDFNPTSKFIHVYMNGDYRGLYMLSDQMHVFPGRVEITFNEDPALSEYYIEWCLHSRDEDDIYFRMRDIVFDFRETEGITPAHVAFVSYFIHQVDAALTRGNFEEISQMIDVPSFVDFYIVQEFSKNLDVFFSSLHFTIRQVDGRPVLFGGPIWDFDQSAGGTAPSQTAGRGYQYHPRDPWAAYSNIWFRALMNVPEFRQLVSDRWFEINEVEVVAMLDLIRDTHTRYIECFERNFDRWPNKLGQNLWRTPPSVIRIPTHEGQVEYLINWFEQRVVWMNGFLS